MDSERDSEDFSRLTHVAGTLFRQVAADPLSLCDNAKKLSAADAAWLKRDLSDRFKLLADITDTHGQHQALAPTMGGYLDRGVTLPAIDDVDCGLALEMEMMGLANSALLPFEASPGASDRHDPAPVGGLVMADPLSPEALRKVSADLNKIANVMVKSRADNGRGAHDEDLRHMADEAFLELAQEIDCHISTAARSPLTPFRVEDVMPVSLILPRVAANTPVLR